MALGALFPSFRDEGFLFVLAVIVFLCRRFWFVPFERRLEPLGVGLVLVVPFVPKVFLVQTF